MSAFDAVDGSSEELDMQAITIGLDIAKSVFQAHSVDADGRVVIRRRLKRRYVLAFFDDTVPEEACASSHHWSRQLIRLRCIPFLFYLDTNGF
jgi:transposase